LPSNYGLLDAHSRSKVAFFRFQINCYPSPESSIWNLESGIKCLLALAHLAQAELDQVFGFEPAAGPSVSLFKHDSKEVIGFLIFAVFDAGLAALILELKGKNRSGRNWLLDFEACSGWGDIFQDRPLAACGSEVRLPLNLYQVGAKLSVIISSVNSHD
jgi:hypothetical protein